MDDDVPPGVQQELDQNSGNTEDLEALKRRLQQMEEEAEKLRNMQNLVEKEMSVSGESGDNADERSIYVGQVDYSATPEELQAHFQHCGTINRVTILCDKFTGHPKGYAYIEFLEVQSVQEAVNLNDSLFKGRQLKVLPKRQNVPSFMRGGRGARAGFMRGAYRPFRGRGRGFRRYNPYFRGRGYFG
eukprot:c8139_g1_i1.p1 GENE.c8139_g1_i1~~c8139_g1_i1.p1  ORF type:complete len:213 (+),score=30.24 c8139_g1_i1:81-641(+)